MILTDGIPGMGKTTSAQFVALSLMRAGHKARWFNDEERGHPLNLWTEAGDPATIQKRAQAWRDFAAETADRDEITVLDGTLQHLLNVLLAMDDTPHAQIRACLDEIAAYIAPLDPLLIYLRPAELPSGLRAMFDGRGAEWEAEMTAVIERGAFAQARGLRGFEAALRYYADFSGLLDTCAQSWPGRCLKLESAATGWAARRAAILEFLNLPAEETRPLADIDTYTGVYQDTDETRTIGGRECHIQAEGGKLYLYDFRYPRGELIAMGPGHFQVETVGYELFFSPGAGQFTVGGKEPAIPFAGFTLLGRNYQKIGSN